ncbi:MAG: Coenzyme F420 hydrogenase/dehydrogenase, beta subunit C-terminal domain [Candidatus Lokiarchaeota archaeon]|nr:Coenzyme F420 hydrogenase/dehydrogenase, beta subunit C-terminal domain [Candidatus Lokiarchaeota archaeon]
MIPREVIRDYFQCDISEYGFQDLHDLVISKKNCVLCGTCMSICPRIGINENQPLLIDYDPECSLCYKYCAKTYFPEKFIEKEIFPKQSTKDPLIGYYQKVMVTKSTNESILNLSQNGGTVTSLLIHALNEGLIDGALLTGKDENWMPKPIIARTSKEIIEATGSIYALASTLLKYEEVINKYKLKRLAFVGMPCQIQAVRKLQFFPPLSDEYGKFTFVIGLYCTSNYTYDSMKDIIENEIGVPINEVKKLDVSHGKFMVYTKEGNIKHIPIKLIKKYNYSSCQYCKDYTAEFSDISIGSIGSQERTWNSVIIRSDVGMNIFKDALKSKKIISSSQIDISQIKNASLSKKLKVVKINEKVISALKLFSIPELEAKAYTTLLSLEKADLSMLSTAMKKEPSEINNAVNILKQRKWISATNGFYKPNNPVKVFKEEIHQLKEKFNSNLKKFKSEVFKELETIYIQNNLKSVKDNEFIDNFF